MNKNRNGKMAIVAEKEINRRIFNDMAFIDNSGIANRFLVDGVSGNVVYLIYANPIPTITSVGSRYRAIDINQFMDKWVDGRYRITSDKDFDSFNIPNDSRWSLDNNFAGWLRF